MPFKRTGNYSQKAGDAISETLYFKNRLRGPCANTRVSVRLGSWNFSISIALVELSIEVFVKFLFCLVEQIMAVILRSTAMLVFA